ncbi:MAG: dTDP-4-dehydrorhamnose reductase [Ferruginibacter sp.]|nr:dTDP-4-dehydrorhamnose reductase [Chitinophagaceae bacterium]
MGTNIKILITGSDGQLGKELEQIAPLFPGFEFIFFSKEDLPVHQPGLVKDFFKNNSPHYLINCAAYTAVDKAEQERDIAFRVNGEAPGVLAAVCKEKDCRFIHISTDYVFDGTASLPYKEDAATNPQTVYGASKLEGEMKAVQFDPAAIIIRTSWVYSEFGKNFVKTMLKLFREKEEINVVNDQAGSPTYAADLAGVILQIISSGQWQPGIYHYTNDGVISWYEFAEVIRELTGNSCKINPIPTSDYPTAAKRPAYSVLDKTKIRQVYGVRLRNWQDSLAECLKKF